MGKKEIVLGVDPGPKGKGCGCVLMRQDEVIEYGLLEPSKVELLVKASNAVVVEMISSYGMAVGMSTFETLIEAGRIVQLALKYEKPIYLMPRKDIKMVICGTAQAKDKNVRASVIDRFPATGGGKIPQIGTKAQPGKLYGVSSHCWPAIASALTYWIAEEERGIDMETFRYTENKWMDYEVEDEV